MRAERKKDRFFSYPRSELCICVFLYFHCQSRSEAEGIFEDGCFGKAYVLVPDSRHRRIVVVCPQACVAVAVGALNTAESSCCERIGLFAGYITRKIVRPGITLSKRSVIFTDKTVKSVVIILILYYAVRVGYLRNVAVIVVGVIVGSCGV